MTVGIQEALASGKLTEAESNTLNGVLAEIVGDIDSVQGVGDNRWQGAGARKVITEIKYKPSSGAVLKATPGKTTTILGSYDQDMKYIIDELGNIETTDYEPNEGGFNVLNIPKEEYEGLTKDQFWEKYDKAWVDKAINRGDDVILATMPKNKYLSYIDNITGEEVLTCFGREHDYGSMLEF